MTNRNIALLAALLSGLMLAGAFGFQIIGDMPPCHLCIYQRWPHGIAFALGIVCFFVPSRAFYWLGAGLVLFGAGIAFYHTGVEQHWWQGPTTCTSQSIAGLDAKDLLNHILNAPLVRCDEIPWSMFGLSMAAWNGLISLGITGLWVRAATRA